MKKESDRGYPQCYSGTQQDRYRTASKRHHGLSGESTFLRLNQVRLQNREGITNFTELLQGRSTLHVHNIYQHLTQHMHHVLMSSCPSLLPIALCMIVLDYQVRFR